MITPRIIALWLIQAVLFSIGIGIAALSAHLGGPLIASAFNIDDLIPSAVIFFGVAAALGWIGDKVWPEDWFYNDNLFL